MPTKQTIEMIDMFGNTVHIEMKEVVEMLLRESVTLFGMTYLTISQLRAEYMKRAGPMPMTEESVRVTFAIR